MDKLKQTIEAILFVASKPLTAKHIAKTLEADAAQVENALRDLAAQRKDAGIILLEANGTWQLATNSAYSTQVKNFLNAELREKLTEATVETLAIVAYRQPISRSEIEAIRGVNSQYSLRHLLIRGLVQKIPNPNDSRQILYETTLEFLQHMGLQNTKDLPEFAKLVEKIKLPENPVGESMVEESETESGSAENIIEE